MADQRIQMPVKITDPTTSSQEMGVDASGNATVILAANDGVDIGDVDVTSVLPGVAAANLGKTLDTAAGAVDVGVGALVVRDDVLAGITPAEGDWASMLVDANGALWTHDNALDAALDGTELQVDVVAPLPAGTNAIGKLAANTGVDIGDVDVLSVAGTVTVDATALDIRALTAATDEVLAWANTAKDGTGTRLK